MKKKDKYRELHENIERIYVITNAKSQTRHAKYEISKLDLEYKTEFIDINKVIKLYKRGRIKYIDDYKYAFAYRQICADILYNSYNKCLILNAKTLQTIDIENFSKCWAATPYDFNFIAIDEQHSVSKYSELISNVNGAPDGYSGIISLKFARDMYTWLDPAIPVKEAHKKLKTKSLTYNLPILWKVKNKRLK